MNWTRLSVTLTLANLGGFPVPTAAAQMHHEPQVAMQRPGAPPGAPTAPSGHGEVHPMGFDDTRTTHRFRLSATGGTIQVRVNDPKDRELRDQVVGHLRMIAEQFAHGNFQAPFAVHGEDPAGVPALKRLSGDISYTCVPDGTGGRVVIATRSKEALAAVHDFLRYQIREHRSNK
jgi:hypothetical protein